MLERLGFGELDLALEQFSDTTDNYVKRTRLPMRQGTVDLCSAQSVEGSTSDREGLVNSLTQFELWMHE